MTVQALMGFLGLNTSAGLWSMASYLAFVVIIIGVFWERYRNLLVTLGAVVLVFYAGIFLKNPLFAALQSLIVLAGALKFSKLSERFAMGAMITTTVLAYIFLVSNDAINDVWSLIGSLGLLGIAFGLAVMPERYGFILMAAGGALLVAYAFAVAAWVFFSLNILFFFANVITWRKQRSV